MDITDAIAVLKKEIAHPENGLPEEVFLYISKITPLVNVDLLIKDEIGRTLLSWRDDEFSGRGWHIPGGIIRFKETLETRIQKVAETEIGATVSFDPVPLALHQCIIPERETRGHFISILYRCFLPRAFIPQNKGLFEGDRGYCVWHASCPDNLLKYHEIYRSYIN